MVPGHCKNSQEHCKKVPERRKKVLEPRKKVPEPRKKVQEPRKKVLEPRKRVQEPRKNWPPELHTLWDWNLHHQPGDLRPQRGRLGQQPLQDLQGEKKNNSNTRLRLRLTEPPSSEVDELGLREGGEGGDGEGEAGRGEGPGEVCL